MEFPWLVCNSVDQSVHCLMPRSTPYPTTTTSRNRPIDRPTTKATTDGRRQRTEDIVCLLALASTTTNNNNNNNNNTQKHMSSSNVLERPAPHTEAAAQPAAAAAAAAAVPPAGEGRGEQQQVRLRLTGCVFAPLLVSNVGPLPYVCVLSESVQRSAARGCTPEPLQPPPTPPH
jgi:hypothetical protein